MSTPRYGKPRAVTGPTRPVQGAPRAVAATPRAVRAQPRAVPAAPRAVAAPAEAAHTSAPSSIELPVAETAPPPRRKFWAKIFASKLILLSIGIHLLFGLGATYLIVQSIQAKRKLTFQGGPNTPNASTRALEHQINMTRRQQTMSAPAQARRITTTGLAKISLPDMPAMPSAEDITPDKMAGMGGMGVGFGMGGGGGGGGGGNGTGVTLFGFHDSAAGGLPGQLYDLKQNPGHQSTGMTYTKYGEVVADFIKSGWHETRLQGYYKASKVLYAPYLCVPEINANLAPKAFDVEKEVQPRQWIAVYKGTVKAPDSGTYHFVGNGDDILFVRFNNKNVLNGNLDSRGQLGGDAKDSELGVKTEARYEYHWPPMRDRRFAKGEAFTVEAGETYPIEIVIGEWPGGYSHFVLLIEKEGDSYEKNGHGAPILPLFRMSDAAVPGDLVNGAPLPAHRKDGPVWPAEGSGLGSLLDTMSQ